MPSFIIDPVLVSTPEADASVDDTVRWVRSLQAWINETRVSPFLWRHCFECTNRLNVAERYPTFAALRSLAQRCGLDVDLAAITRGLAAFFQDETKDYVTVTTTRCIVPKDSPNIVPDEVVARILPEVRSAFIDCLLCLACDKQALVDFAMTAHIVTLPFTSSNDSVTVRCIVELVEPSNIAAILGQQAIDQGFRAVFSPDMLEQVISPAEMWQAGPEEFVRGVRRLSATFGGTPIACSLHHDFWASLTESTIHTDLDALGKLRRLCASIAAGLGQRINVDLRPLRTTKAAASPQHIRSSDGARAWRLTIVDKGIGWRLHYWHIPARQPSQEESIQFANVVTKHDAERIPE